MRAPDHAPRRAVIVTQGWEGRQEQPVLVVGETPTRYRVTPAMGSVKLAGRNRWLQWGETALVPKRAVRFTEIARA